jgi:ADP-ribose pyrophosphatase YjhB (NUDIX family)
MTDTLVNDRYSTKKDRHTIRAAVFVFLMKEEKTFLLRRQNTGWADGMFTVPSGHVDAGETVPQAAIKEVVEEAGVTVREEDLEFVHVQYVHDVYVNFYFRTERWEGEPHIGEPELASECGWFPLSGLPHDTIYHIQAMLLESRGGYFSGVRNDPNPTHE